MKAYKFQSEEIKKHFEDHMIKQQGILKKSPILSITFVFYNTTIPRVTIIANTNWMEESKKKNKQKALEEWLIEVEDTLLDLKYGKTPSEKRYIICSADLSLTKDKAQQIWNITEKFYRYDFAMAHNLRTKPIEKFNMSQKIRRIFKRTPKFLYDIADDPEYDYESDDDKPDLSYDLTSEFTAPFSVPGKSPMTVRLEMLNKTKVKMKSNVTKPMNKHNNNKLSYLDDDLSWTANIKKKFHNIVEENMSAMNIKIEFYIYIHYYTCSIMIGGTTLSNKEKANLLIKQDNNK